ncbi:hypothetical protein [Natrarchaeobius oligotrophus]|uniref:Uncharacterized protein n=1 Tax=Natrarchaeobius chitinivorans TaxID=1679083 RepID=A0A3N6NAC6_NATCH|nr:hypothetical protein [Natrarchaeobius chitinivorans]RQG95562.1 hypothetical protein EA472_21580 [Natrarchaeobius chitinivorans]
MQKLMAQEGYGLIPAVTASGKSTNGATTSWSDLVATGGEPVVHLHGTTDARDEAVEKSEDAGVSYHVLYGRDEICETAAGEHNDSVSTPSGTPASEWINHQCGQGSGTTLSTAHAHLEEHNGGELPCSPCDAKTQYDGIPRDEDGDPAVDVIHATHQFAYVPSLIDNTNVIIDEQPDFSSDVSQGGEFTQQRIQEMVTAWLKHIDAYVKTWEEFAVLAREGLDRLEDTVETDHDVEPEWFIKNTEAHTLAPAITEAVYKALSSPPDDNERHSATAPHDLTRLEEINANDFRYSRTRVTVVIDKDNRVQKVWNTPELGNARSVICLDAWPSMPEFHQNVGENLELKKLMTEGERERWRRFERGLEVVQIGDSARPAGSEYAVKHYFNSEEVRVVIEWLRTIFDEDFRAVIAPSRVEEEVQEMMRHVEIEDPDEWTMHHGEEKSRGEFSEEPVGFVTNCIDPGDDYVLDLLAAQGLDATPHTVDCRDCGGSGCQKCGGTGERRARGRGFEGPDADKAQEILDGLRANHTNQCVGRWARKPGQEGVRSLVFVRTDTVDDILVDKTIPDPWVFGDKQQAAIDYLRKHPKTTLKETKEGIETQFDSGVAKESVRETFKKLIEHGVAERSEGTGAYGADEYRLTSSVPEHGLVKYPELNRRKSPTDPL